MEKIEEQLKNLPEPPIELQNHSAALIDDIIEKINIKPEKHMSFRRYMERVLYHPQYGYYSGALQTFGYGGDFTTAPETSSLFSQVLGIQVSEILKQTNGSILEFGAGSGIMAADILLQLERLGRLPEQYFILDLSSGLKKRQQKTLREKAPHLIEKVSWINTLPNNFNGVMLANEVLDAMPVERFKIISGEVHRNVVRIDQNRFVDDFILPTPSFTNSVNLLPNRENYVDGYLSEFNPNLSSWFAMLEKSLNEGAIILIDYGYHGAEYYRDERIMGTLICHYQHRVFDEPYTYPGLCDITANVDFSAVQHAANQAGLITLGYTSQANFLLHGGLSSLLEERLTHNHNTLNRLKLAQQVKTLTSPTDMGERFKVIGFAKHLDDNISGFTSRNQMHML